MTKKVEVLDAIMGSGKTTSIIQWMDNNPCERYIYVSPLLSEVGAGGRIQSSLKNILMATPEDNGEGKAESMLELLRTGANIACTHALYKLLTDAHFDEIESHGYVVIVDEELGLIEPFREYSIEDLRWLQNEGYIKSSENDGMIEWLKHSPEIGKPTHKYHKIHQMCLSGCLYSTKRSDTMVTVQLPSRLIECAKRIIVLTYLFKGGVLEGFLKLKGFETVPFTEAVGLNIVSGKAIRELLVLTPPPKGVSHLHKKLTYSWYETPDKGELDKISNAIRSLAKKWGVDRDHLIYTFPKKRSVSGDGVGVKIKPKGLVFNSNGSPCWLAAQTRATNDYSHVTHIVHAYNRHPNVAVISYLQDFGVPVGADTFALSELIQFLWRGCIRNGQPMHVCIFSSRMEKLLRNWLDSLPD